MPPEIQVAETVALPALLAGSGVLVLLLAGLFLWAGWLWQHRQTGFVMPRHLGALRALPWDMEDLLRLGIGISGMLLAFMLLGGWLRQGGMDERAVARMAVWQNTLLQAVVAGLVGLRIRARGAGLRGSFQSPAAPAGGDAIRQGVRYYVLVFPVVLLVLLLWQGLLKRLGVEGTPQPVLLLAAGEGVSIWVQVWLVLAALVGAPLLEEIIFRGMLLPVVLRRMDWRMAVVCSSALFALVHGHVPSMVPLFVVGVAFSLAYLYSGSLLVPMVMHAAFNGVNLLVFFLYQAAAS